MSTHSTKPSIYDVSATGLPIRRWYRCERRIQNRATKRTKVWEILTGAAKLHKEPSQVGFLIHLNDGDRSDDERAAFHVAYSAYQAKIERYLKDCKRVEKAKEILLEECNEDAGSIIHSAQTPSEAFSKLKEAYSGGYKHELHMLVRDWNMLHMNQYVHIEPFLLELEELRKDLTFYRCDIRDKVMIATITCKLTPAYDRFVAKHTQDIRNGQHLTLGKFKQRLLGGWSILLSADEDSDSSSTDEETFVSGDDEESVESSGDEESFEPSGNEESVVSSAGKELVKPDIKKASLGKDHHQRSQPQLQQHFTSSPQSKRPRRKCSRCGRWGHDEDACWYKHPKLRPARR